MSRWEGEVVRPGNEKLDSRIHITGTNARDQRLQHQITADDLQHKPSQDGHPDLAVLGHEKEDPGENEGRRQLALRHGVALWDVLAGCRIRGASDAAIRDPEPNDLAPILAGAPIRAIFATGKTAAALYHKLIEPVTGRPILPLPSPSPANCAVSLPALIESYRQLLAFLPQGEEETA